MEEIPIPKKKYITIMTEGGMYELTKVELDNDESFITCDMLITQACSLIDQDKTLASIQTSHVGLKNEFTMPIPFGEAVKVGSTVYLYSTKGEERVSEEVVLEGYCTVLINEEMVIDVPYDKKNRLQIRNWLRLEIGEEILRGDRSGWTMTEYDGPKLDKIINFKVESYGNFKKDYPHIPDKKIAKVIFESSKEEALSQLSVFIEENDTQTSLIKKACTIMKYNENEWFLDSKNTNGDTIYIKKRMKPWVNIIQFVGPDRYLIDIVEEMAETNPHMVAHMSNPDPFSEIVQYAIIFNSDGDKEINVRKRQCNMLGLSNPYNYIIVNEKDEPCDIIHPKLHYILKKK